MADKITLDRIELLHPKLRLEAHAIYNELCALYTDRFIRFTSTLRTFPEQKEMYAQGRTKPGNIITHSKPGQSYHNYGLAVDVCTIKDGKADFNTPKEVVNIFKAHGWEWGGEFKSFRDIPHFQKTYSLSIGDLLAKHLNGDFITDTLYVNI